VCLLIWKVFSNRATKWEVVILDCNWINRKHALQKQWYVNKISGQVSEHYELLAWGSLDLDSGTAAQWGWRLLPPGRTAFWFILDRTIGYYLYMWSENSAKARLKSIIFIKKRSNSCGSWENLVFNTWPIQLNTIIVKTRTKMCCHKHSIQDLSCEYIHIRRILVRCYFFIH
jgi:hypothetical protein